MNKKTQKTFDFYNTVYQKEKPIEESNIYKKLEERTPKVIQVALDNMSGIEEILSFFSSYKLKSKQLEIDGKLFIIIDLANKTYIIDDLQKPVLKLYNKEIL